MTIKIPSTGKPKRKPDYYLEEIDNDFILYHFQKTQTVYLNQTASILWGLCDGRRTVDEILALFQDAFPQDNIDIHSDIKEILQQLLSINSIEIL